MNPENKLLVLLLVGVHGLQGNLKVKSFCTDNSILLKHMLYDDEGNEYKIRSCKVIGKSIVVNIKGINHIDQAQALLKRKLYIDKNKLDDLEEGEYYLHSMIDCKVYDNNNNLLGNVSEVYNFGAADIIEVQQQNKSTILISMHKENVIDLDLENKKIIIMQH